ncbi:MAG TPA: ABC transporter permease [Candidatus Acidoferrales bacterium]|nr:ABC transporter permease [Candidatus Acidoferrales bacterium]
MAEDLRYAFRVLLKAPGFTAVAVLTLALAIGATSTIFSAVNAVLIRQLPYPDPGRLAMVWGDDRARGEHRSQICYPDVEDWRAQNHVFEDIAAFTGYWSPVLSTPSGVEQLDGVRVSDGFFRVMHTQPLLGRTFLPEEQLDGRGDVAILSYGLWERSFGRDPAILGGKITISGKPYTVVGVLPQSFRPLPVRVQEHGADIFRPLTKQFSDEIRNGRHLRAVARLKPGVSLAQAQDEMNVISRRLEAQYPDANLGRGAQVVGLHDDLVQEIRPALLILQACVLMIVLIACANVANLLLARSASRRRELAIRQALGAGRGRLVRQMLTESLLLALMGGAAGMLVAWWCIPVLEHLGAKTIPELAQVNIDWHVAAVCGVLSLVTGLVFGTAPALEMSAANPVVSLKEGSRGGSRASAGGRRRGLLVVAETAVALMLLVSAGLLVNSFVRLQRVNPGFDPRHTLAADLSLPGSRYPDGDRRAAFLDRLLAGIRRLPGVESASVVSVLPESSNFNRMGLDVEGRVYTTATRPDPDQYEVTGDYFRTVSIPLRSGRLFTERDDRDHAQVALINETMARGLWPGEDPIGRKVRTGGKEGSWRTIVGIVGDVYQYGLDSPKTMQIYLPYKQNRVPSVTLLVRGVRDPTPLTPAIRAAVAAIDRELPLADVITLDQLLADSVSGRRFSMMLLAALGACAMLLAAIGIYGVTAYSVAQRTEEFGIRMALGAAPASVIGMVMRQNLTLIGAGTCAGLAIALTSTRLLSKLLFGVSPFDPATFAAAAVLLAIVAMAASYVPARRATRVDPMVALRGE